LRQGNDSGLLRSVHDAPLPLGNRAGEEPTVTKAVTVMATIFPMRRGFDGAARPM
jgi:hypothetical protein